jgi:hypothetical protein
MRNGMKIVDIHNHFYSRPWLDYLAQRTEVPRFEWTGPDSGIARIGDFTPSHVDKPGDFDIEARIADLDDAGIDQEIDRSSGRSPVFGPEADHGGGSAGWTGK